MDSTAYILQSVVCNLQKQKGVVAMAYVQISGVFLSVWFGTVTWGSVLRKETCPASTIILFAAGCAMATCGMFL